MRQIIAAINALGGIIRVDSQMGALQRDNPNTSDQQRQLWTKIHQSALEAKARIARLQASRWDPQARERLRQIARESAAPSAPWAWSRLKSIT